MCWGNVYGIYGIITSWVSGLFSLAQHSDFFSVTQENHQSGISLFACRWPPSALAANLCRLKADTLCGLSGIEFGLTVQYLVAVCVLSVG
jgi:hypothetical protein